MSFLIARNLNQKFMASSTKVFGTGSRARSVSLPSRPHPTIHELNVILDRLLSSDSGTASSSSSIRNCLNGLHNLYDCLDGLLLLPETQQILAKEWKSVNQLLDGSLRLLDVSAAAKDSILQIKEFTHNLQLALRRKGSDAKEARKYLACRKNVKKSIQKALSAFKCVPETYEEHGSLFMVAMLREVEQVTFSVLESLMSFISGPKEKSLVSKLMQSKRTNSEEKNANEFEKIDIAMRDIVALKTLDISNIQGDLGTLELGIGVIEEGIECLFKQLIKIRVTLLNIISHC